MIYLLIICLIIIGFLGYKLCQKQKIDKTNLEIYQNDLQTAKEEFRQILKDTTDAEAKLKVAREATEYEQYKLEECRKDLQAALDVYQEMVDNRIKEIDAQMEEQRQKRQHDLDTDFKTKQDLITATLDKYQAETNEEMSLIQKDVDELRQQAFEQSQVYQAQLKDEKEKIAGIIRTLAQYEKDRQARLFYTIQLPEEYYEDIEFLLTTVAAKVQHPDIISKLVWAEYVKPYLEETFKRIEIKSEAGIYKLTHLDTGMAYIGKSTDVKKRIADHFKSAVGITSIADQRVHHAILKTGFWNWQIEVITYCDKDKLNELEKYYIEFFKTQEYGYNKNAGGGG